MRWSWNLGQYLGIKVYIHWTFLILIAWVLFTRLGAGETVMQALGTLLFVLSIFLCVLLHEFGHALAARRFGIRTRDITLLPIGGLARLERMPSDPVQELIVAIAGPAVNVGIAAILFVILLLLKIEPTLDSINVASGDFVALLLYANVALVIFNMLPAFPMDGGRVLRALLATSMEYVRATRIASSVGQIMAIGFGLLGLFVNPFLVFIALFVFLGAQAEAQHAEVRWSMRGVPVRDAMITRFITLASDDPIQDAIDALLRGEQQDFPVVHDGRIVGLLPRNRLVQALANSGPQTPVRDVMVSSPPLADPSDMLDATLERLRASDLTAFPVERHGELIGLVTLENIGEWLMVQNAIKGLRPRQHAMPQGEQPGTQ